MRALQIMAVSALWLAPVLAIRGAEVPVGAPGSAATAAAAQPAPKGEGSCGKFGTQVDFVGTPSEAARQAAKEEKLVFVLHVSGLFEDPRLT
jgi:hypothetical protein